MPKNLIELIKASGSAGISGQSFAGNVAGATTNTAMSDYLITDWFFDPTELPVYGIGGATYQSGHTFNITANFIRGSKAQFIQRQNIPAFEVMLLPLTGGGAGAYAEIVSLVNFNNGQALTIGIRVWGRPTGSASVTTGTQVVADFGNYREIRFFATVQTTTPSTFEDYSLLLDYDPDIANFNFPLDNRDEFDNGWPLQIFDRAYSFGDLQFRWWHDLADAEANNTATLASSSGDVIVSVFRDPTYNKSMYMRWAPVGTNSWSTVVTVTYEDTTLIPDPD